MNNIRYNNVIGTCSQIVVAGLIASQLIPTGMTYSRKDTDYMRQSQTEYDPIYNQFSYNQFISDQYSSNFSIDKSTTENIFERSIGDFYAKLLANQEPLGSDFEEVLHNNLWDLYES
ncbi:MAG: hypothetical protein KDJ34_19365 [Candidatus Competibacteraceae bacterium]|nr:hypothetical protein [Candidatus Competibacteraceae bacterium]